jgi:hypothetical protein
VQKLDRLFGPDLKLHQAAALSLGELGGAARAAIPRLRALAEAPLNLISIDGSLTSSSLVSDPRSILYDPPIEKLVTPSPRHTARAALRKIEAAE